MLHLISASKVPHTEEGARRHRMPLAASELEEASIPRKRSEKGKGGGKRRVLEGLALDEKGRAYELARDVVERPQQT